MEKSEDNEQDGKHQPSRFKGATNDSHNCESIIHIIHQAQIVIKPTLTELVTPPVTYSIFCLFLVILHVLHATRQQPLTVN